MGRLALAGRAAYDDSPWSPAATAAYEPRPSGPVPVRVWTNQSGKDQTGSSGSWTCVNRMKKVRPSWVELRVSGSDFPSPTQYHSHVNQTLDNDLRVDTENVDAGTEEPDDGVDEPTEDKHENA